MNRNRNVDVSESELGFPTNTTISITYDSSETWRSTEIDNWNFSLIGERKNWESGNYTFVSDSFLLNSPVAIQWRIPRKLPLSSRRLRSLTPARSTSRQAPENKSNAEFALKLTVIDYFLSLSLFLSLFNSSISSNYDSCISNFVAGIRYQSDVWF